MKIQKKNRFKQNYEFFIIIKKILFVGKVNFLIYLIQFNIKRIEQKISSESFENVLDLIKIRKLEL